MNSRLFDDPSLLGKLWVGTKTVAVFCFTLFLFYMGGENIFTPSPMTGIAWIGATVFSLLYYTKPR